MRIAMMDDDGGITKEAKKNGFKPYVCKGCGDERWEGSWRKLGETHKKMNLKQVEKNPDQFHLIYCVHCSPSNASKEFPKDLSKEPVVVL